MSKIKNHITHAHRICTSVALRVSTIEQNLNLQIDALEQAGCQKIITDTVSGARVERPGLAKLKELLREGDTLVIWKLDRLGRSLKNLIEWIQYLDKEGVALKSLKENIDTSTSTGKLIFHIFGALSEFERDLIRERTQAGMLSARARERTQAGMLSARARGRMGGRPRGLDQDKRELAMQLYNSGKYTVDKICELVGGISRKTFYNIKNEAEAKGKNQHST